MSNIASTTQRFQHQQVRDLAWACLSPPLLQNLPASDVHICTTGDHRRDESWLAALDQDPSFLLAELTKYKSTRLGIYFENLLRFYWQQDQHTELLAHNLQVQAPDVGELKGSTQGAFDFLLRTQDQFWHIESAVKFYLGVPDGSTGPSQWSRWIGPNCNDRLDIKLNHLRDHQLALCANVHAQKRLAEIAGSAQNWHKGLRFQGYLFYPALQSMSAPIASNPQHLRGSWWYLQDFLQLDPKGYWLVLPRERWLSPAQTSDIHELYCGDNLREVLHYWLAERQKPQLLAAMQKKGGIWIETGRSFIVPDHWPWNDFPSRNT